MEMTSDLLCDDAIHTVLASQGQGTAVQYFVFPILYKEVMRGHHQGLLQCIKGVVKEQEAIIIHLTLSNRSLEVKLIGSVRF